MKLYLIHVGFYEEAIGIYELHTNYLIAADNPKDAKEKMKSKPFFQEKKMHIDGMQEITEVDGHSVILQPLVNQQMVNATLGYDAVKSL